MMSDRKRMHSTADGENIEVLDDASDLDELEEDIERMRAAITAEMPEMKKKYGIGDGPIDYEAKIQALRENPPPDILSEEEMKENLEKTGWFDPSKIFDRIPADSATAKLLEPTGEPDDDPFEVPPWPTAELGPGPLEIDLKKAQETLDNWEDLEEDEKIHVLLDVAKAYTEDELVLARRLVYRSVRELDTKPGNTWLRSMTGYVAKMLHMEVDIAAEFDEELDDLVESLDDVMLSDEEFPALKDPRLIWQVMPPSIEFKHPAARPPPFNKEPEWPPDFQRKKGPPSIDPKEIWKLDFEAMFKAKDEADAAAAGPTANTANPSSSSSSTKPVKTSPAGPTVTKAKGETAQSQPKRRRVVRLDEAPPPQPKAATTGTRKAQSAGDRPMKKKKKYTVSEVFGDKLNALADNLQSTALLEAFIAKEKRPANAGESNRIKIHEEVDTEPTTGIITTTTLSVLLDWEKFSFKKVRSKKKSEAPTQPPPIPQQPPETVTTPAPIPQPLPAPAPPPPSQSGGAPLPALAFADDDDDDDD